MHFLGPEIPENFHMVIIDVSDFSRTEEILGKVQVSGEQRCTHCDLPVCSRRKPSQSRKASGLINTEISKSWCRKASFENLAFTRTTNLCIKRVVLNKYTAVRQSGPYQSIWTHNSSLPVHFIYTLADCTAVCGKRNA